MLWSLVCPALAAGAKLKVVSVGDLANAFDSRLRGDYTEVPLGSSPTKSQKDVMCFYHLQLGLDKKRA